MERLKKYLIAVLAIGLLSELYFYPFQGEFRFSVGVLALNLVLLLYIDLKEIYLGIFTAGFVLFFRIFINLFSTDVIFFQALKSALPASIYYLLYCILIFLVKFRKNKDFALISVFTLFSIDVFSNIFESLLRNTFNFELFLLKNEEILIRKKEHQKRYVELNSVISNIQSEIFYLNKSMKDIENVMSKSYLLYENNKDNKTISQSALDIARDTHEIKKDYYRVIAGLESFMNNFEKDSMSLKDIFSIILDNINKYIIQENKDVDIDFEFTDNYKINNFYLIFTILNNLIINSIDASNENGTIKVQQTTKNQMLVLIVEDAGKGIDEEILPFIFNPGFTTKFDEHTGDASTGIGLPHIKNIVDDLNGTIDINSIVGRGTKFIISLPLDSILI